MLRVEWLLLCAASWVACDDRCNKIDCATLFDDCGSSLPAEPNYARCGLRREDHDDEKARFRCGQACVASNAGEVLECVAEDRQSCRGGRGPTVVATCAGLLEPAPADFAAKCAPLRETCEADCPTTNKVICLDCMARCGLAWGRCDAACRSPK